MTTVREHPMRVPISKKNPTGVTIRDQHSRYLKGTYLDRNEIESIFKNYDRKKITYPGQSHNLGTNSDKYKILQNPKGETKDFIFKDIRKKDLLDPSINIPMGIRWLYRKKRLAEGKLGRSADHEDIILEYKGLLKSKTPYKDKGLEKYRYAYKQLKKK